MNMSSGRPSLAVQTAAGLTPSNTRAWTVDKLTAIARSRSDSPAGAAIALFEVLDDIFNRADREARMFVSALGRMTDRGNHDGGTLRLEFHDAFLSLAIEADLVDSDGFARSCDLLLSGATSCAVGGDFQSALRARDMVRGLVSGHRAYASARPIADGTVIDFTEYDEASLYEHLPRPVSVAVPLRSGEVRPVTDLDKYLDDLEALIEQST